jgi:2,5-dihydroxypyridine 5,6-dioxygenase
MEAKMTMRPQETNPFSLAFYYKKEFELCNVTAGETIVLVTDLSTRTEYVQAAFAAASEIGAGIYEMKVNRKYSTTHIGGEWVFDTKGSIEAIEAADLVVAHHIPLGSNWMARGTAAGTRFLMIYDAPDDLGRLMSPPGLKEAAIYARDKIHNAREMRVISDAGTDFRCQLGDMMTSCQYGYAEEPGRVDHWGAGHFSTWPNIGTAEGTIVYQPGDCWILPYVRYFEDECRLEIENGVIVSVEGKTDAKLMRDFSDAHKKHDDDDEPYHVSHLGWGLNPNAVIDQIAVHGPNIERIGGTGRAWPGSFLFSTGPNSQSGGTNDTACHIDTPMFGCTVMIIPAGSAPPLAPYSPGVKIGNTVYVSGNLALDANGDIVGPGDVQAQTRHVIEAIKLVVEAAGGTLADVAFNHIFLADLADYAAMNKVYAEYFGTNPPARYCIRADLVKPEFLVEIAAIAHLE